VLVQEPVQPGAFAKAEIQIAQIGSFVSHFLSLFAIHRFVDSLIHQFTVC
jgi:hypothetical protein